MRINLNKRHVSTKIRMKPNQVVSRSHIRLKGNRNGNGDSEDNIMLLRHNSNDCMQYMSILINLRNQY